MFSYLISFLSFARVISALCYDINGNLVTTADYVPCNSISGTISMCCALNRGSSSSFTPDTCLPNGLCQNVYTNQTTNKPDTGYWRDYCSNPEWNPQYCLPAVCTTSSEGNSTEEMTPCDDTPTSEKWCCGTHNTACCGTGQEIVLAATLGVAMTSSSTSKVSSAASSSTTTSSFSSTTTAPTTSQSSSSTPKLTSSALSTGAKAGIGIGSAALVVLVVAAILYFLYFFRRKNSSRAGNLGDEHGAGQYQGERKPELHGISKQQLAEVQGGGVDVGSREPLELGG